MKVLRVIARLNVGGPARHVILLDAGLRARGYDTLLVHGSVGPGEANLEDLASRGRIRTLKIRELGRRISPLSDLRAFVQLVSLVYREAPDVIHTHAAKAGALGRLAAMTFNATRPRRARCVVVHTFHGHVLSGYFGRAGNLLVRVAERTLAAITDRVITISPAQRDDIVLRFHVARADRTAVVPLGLDLEPLLQLSKGAPDLRTQLGVEARAIVLGYVGRFVPIKDLATLIRAFAVALGAHPDMFLVLVGDGPLRPRLELLADELGIASRVRFAGWTEDLTSVYATIDVCAMSSLNEGTPAAIIEAMAAAKPVVATAVGGVPDVIEDGRTGILVPARDVGALARAFVRLATFPAERLRLGEAARRVAGVRFSRDRLVVDVDRLYRQALIEKRRVQAPTW